MSTQQEPTERELQEAKYYQSVTVERRNVIDALKSIGFIFEQPSWYKSALMGHIDVDRLTNMTDLLVFIFKAGQKTKIRELKKALEIYD